VAGGLVIALGIFMVVWVSTTFVRKGNGTPVPTEPPTRLVVQGLYRFVRNPMYVGAILVVLGEAVFSRTAWLVLYAAALWLVLHIALVTWEEQDLRKRFGPDYEQYLKSVPRWIPRVPTRDA
jgi:protein-S-isoprenylcysteine O-methyltransferase Ste14